MLHYAVARLLWLIPTLLAMALVTFVVMHATPGSPLDPLAGGANPLSPKPWVRGIEKNKQGELVVEGNIYVDMLTHLYMVEKARGATGRYAPATTAR